MHRGRHPVNPCDYCILAAHHRSLVDFIELGELGMKLRAQALEFFDQHLVLLNNLLVGCSIVLYFCLHGEPPLRMFLLIVRVEVLMVLVSLELVGVVLFVCQ